MSFRLIRERDVGRFVYNVVTSRVIFLAGVLGKTHRRLAVGVAVAQKLGQLAILAVGERIHRVNDDRLDTLAEPWRRT